MGKIAFVFPGQGSQAVGMGQELKRKFPEVASIIEKADEKLGYSLSSLMFEGPQEELTLTYNAQPALLTTSISILAKLKEAGIKADYVAGHSLGEYSALVAAGSISFEDAVQTVHLRGKFMEEAVPAGKGTMAAVLGLDEAVLQEVTEQVTSNIAPVQLANLNCPGQIVISGSTEGVLAASELAKEKGAKRVIPLVVSGPFHSSLMQPAAEKLAAALKTIDVKNTLIPVIANVDAHEMQEQADINEKLVQQLYSPVRWEQSVERMIELGVDTFIEVGPGKVLSGLIKKINRRVTTIPVYDMETLQKALDHFQGEDTTNA
ncbi:[acyl-carrier-protein] S-malonyltransferase [Bacillus tianshenii]|uniref:Malonyl CoA-acyl carrier protein transacylase n=1 Tax=Sutcliffiella tianshenii TaxID=1463404 RepID=A0ABS2NWB1_9BACI|nr:ACP S-malonyltransferase [Bacillus tianshenii]MBM7618955.1 [acyl-carrier-protein] S-malonyltransferase [Bacillus tianshenii]